MKQEKEKADKEKAEYLAGWQRCKADFLNYKKEEVERVSTMLKYANEDLILKILPILDNFELFEKNIKKQMQDFLKNQGIEEIKGVGERFDPNFHEAVEQVTKEDKKSGVIIEIVQKGYKLHGKVIRPARVKIVK